MQLQGELNYLILTQILPSQQIRHIRPALWAGHPQLAQSSASVDNNAIKQHTQTQQLSASLQVNLVVSQLHKN